MCHAAGAVREAQGVGGEDLCVSGDESVRSAVICARKQVVTDPFYDFLVIDLRPTVGGWLRLYDVAILFQHLYDLRGRGPLRGLVVHQRADDFPDAFGEPQVVAYGGYKLVLGLRLDLQQAVDRREEVVHDRAERVVIVLESGGRARALVRRGEAGGVEARRLIDAYLVGCLEVYNLQLQGLGVDDDVARREVGEDYSVAVQHVDDLRQLDEYPTEVAVAVSPVLDRRPGHEGHVVAGGVGRERDAVKVLLDQEKVLPVLKEVQRLRRDILRFEFG